jgi:hypothetical protein
MENLEESNPITVGPKWAAAMSKAQSEFPAISKDGKNKFVGNSYYTLDNLIATVKPILAKYGLFFTQTYDDKGVTTIVMHESGEYLVSGPKQLRIPEAKGVSVNQAEAIALTYTKRYQLSSMLGVTTSDDLDGNVSAQGNDESKKPKKKLGEEEFKQFLDMDISNILKYKESYAWTPDQKKQIAAKLAAVSNGKSAIEKIKQDFSE